MNADNVTHVAKPFTGIIYDLQGFLLLRRVVTTDFGNAHRNPPIHTPICRFSPSAGARMRRFLRTCTAEFKVFITLTYPAVFPCDGRVVKRNLRAFLARYRRNHVDGQPWAAFWFLEFQERGAPHLHIFGTDRIEHAELAKWWYEIVGSGDPQHLEAGTSIEALRSGRHGTCVYASKYAVKAEQKEVPKNFSNCGRFWGCEGNRSCMSATLLIPKESVNSPEYVAFRSELRELIAENKKKVKILDFKGISSGLYIKDDGLRAEIRLLLARYGCLMTIKGLAAYESPLLEQVPLIYDFPP